VGLRNKVGAERKKPRDRLHTNQRRREVARCSPNASTQVRSTSPERCRIDASPAPREGSIPNSTSSRPEHGIVWAVRNIHCPRAGFPADRIGRNISPGGNAGASQRFQTEDEARRIAANIAKLPTLLIAGGVIGRADATIIQMRGINRRHPTSDHEQNLTHRRHDDPSGS
jgi:hypothetical protein